MGSRVKTVMFTDIKGFTARTSSTSREELRTLLDMHEKLLLPVVERFGGRLIKTIGDALLVTFDSPTNGVLCGIMMQATLADFNAQMKPTDRIEIRVAINLGEVEERDGDVFGEAVNIAARIEGITEAGEVYFTEAVYLGMNKSEVPSSAIGFRLLKGIPEPVKVYRVIQDKSSENYQALVTRLRTKRYITLVMPGAKAPAINLPEQAAGGKSRPKKYLLPVVAGAALLVIALVVFYPASTPTSRQQTPATSPEVQNQKAAHPTAGKGPIEEPEPSLEQQIMTAARSGNISQAMTLLDQLRSLSPEQAAATGARALGVAVAPLLAEARFDEAGQLVARETAGRSWIDAAPVSRDISLGRAARLYDSSPQEVAAQAYEVLMDEWPEDNEVAAQVLARFGASSPNGYHPLGLRAAWKIASSSSGPLDTQVFATLLRSLSKTGPLGAEAARLRAVLLERAKAETLARALETIESDDIYSRVNAYYLLRDGRGLSDEVALRYHFKNLTTMPTPYKQLLEESIGWARERSARPDWGGLKASAELAPLVRSVASIREFSPRQREVLELLADAFAAEVEQQMRNEALSGEVWQARVNAFNLLTRADLLADFDFLTYHLGVVQLFNIREAHPCFSQALAYLRTRGDHRELISPRLVELISSNRSLVEKLEQIGSPEWASNARRNLTDLEETLKAMDRRVEN